MVGPHLINVAMMMIIIIIMIFTLPLILSALELLGVNEVVNKGSESMSLCYINELKMTSVYWPLYLFLHRGLGVLAQSLPEPNSNSYISNCFK